MKLAILLSASLLFLPSASIAEIQKIATPSDNGIRFLWWPKVSPPAGWHFDKGSSYYLSFNAMAPDGGTFSKAETVMYAKANFKPRTPNIKSLEALIQADISGSAAAEPGSVAKRDGLLHSADGKEFRVVMFIPGKSGNWERVAYGEEGEFYLLFTISSRTKAGLSASLPAFKSMVSGYRERP